MHVPHYDPLAFPIDRRSLLISLTAASALSVGLPAALDPVAITISPQPKQMFNGFGVSQPRNTPALANLPPSTLHPMLDLVYRDLPISILRLWVPSFPDWDEQRMLNDFEQSYLAGGLLDQINARCAPSILLAPARREAVPRDNMSAYGKKIARFIGTLHSEMNVTVSVTGVANEPEGFADRQMIDAIIALREGLDTGGLRSVGIVAPESASANQRSATMIRAIRATPAAWRALRGIATHSYNMAANDPIAALSEGKEYWITEAGRGLAASGGGNEASDEGGEAATVAGRFLADLNHRVTHWIWFIGVSAKIFAPNHMGEQALVCPGADDKAEVLLKYQYLKHLLACFPAKSIIHPATSAHDGTMGWTYGRKPALTATAARRPDGRLCVCMVNATGLPSNFRSFFDIASDIPVELQLPARNTPFRIFVTDRHATMKDHGTLTTDTAGRCQIYTLPRQLISLLECN